MKKAFHDESVCQGKKQDRGGQADYTAKPNLSDLSKGLFGNQDVIPKALKSRSLQCPGCKKKHISEYTVGTVGFWVEDGDTTLENWMYFICKHCLKKYGSADFTRRIERRLRKNTDQYGIDILMFSMAVKAGIDLFQMNRGGDYRTDPWVLDDKEWFENNPDRSHRIRRIFSEDEAESYKRTDEGLCEGWRLVGVAVQQIEPGFRNRIQVCYDENTTDAEAGAIIDRMNASEDEASRSMMAAIQSRQGKQIQPEDIIPSAGMGRPS